MTAISINYNRSLMRESTYYTQPPLSGYSTVWLSIVKFSTQAENLSLTLSFSLSPSPASSLYGSVAFFESSACCAFII